MKKSVLHFLIFGILFSFAAAAQDSVHDALRKSYSNYELQKIETSKLYEKVSNTSEFHKIPLTIGDEIYNLELWDSGLKSENYKVTLADGTKHKRSSAVPLKGYVNGDQGSNVRLTINKGFISGYIMYEGKRLNIQPASYHDASVEYDTYVAYYDTDVISTGDHSCGVHGDKYIKRHLRESIQVQTTKQVGLCFETEIALAADWSMVQQFGSTGAVEDQIETVLNDVEGNYDDEFADEILYDLVDVWISNCATCDPWTSSTDPDDLLDEFTDWAPGNLGGHDVASLWSDRNFDGSTIGLAWVGGVCTNFCYNVLENFTTSSSELRVLQAHELGHNWDAGHDGGSSPHIMAPSVSSSTTWSSNSMNDIEDWVTGSGCLSSCTASGSAPSADFDYDIIEECVDGEVEFEDDSDGASTWFWTFEGGSPATSNVQNPVVFYLNPGTFDVTLEVSNPFGSDTYFLEDEIEIFGEPIADFEYEGSELEISFYDDSNAGSEADYYWEFGDGDNSNQMDPVHFYPEPGTYPVLLEVENQCGDDMIFKDIEVYDDPEVSFTVDNTSGCVGDEFEFTDLSYGNIVEWDWQFPGGTPSSSNMQNPEVEYTTSGVFDVTLTVTNPEGDETITETAYISILDAPTSSFSYTQQANVVTFANTSTSATSYSWNFGDGNTSSLTSPVHTYASSGTYQVVLTATNSCGTVTNTQSVSISLQPSAQISTAQAPSGCAPYSIGYLDNSSGNPTSWSWTFAGGTPASSTIQNPTVAYNNQGTYNVTLEVTNAFGTDIVTLTNYVDIDDVPDMTAAYTSNLLAANFTSNLSNASSILWNFGDGNTSNQNNPTHNYAVEGTYNVTATATNGCGAVTQNLTVVITLQPVAGITSNVTTGCTGMTVSYQDNSSANTTAWDWSFPGGNPSSSTLQNPVVSYASAGSYDVMLTVSNSAGSDTQTWNDYISVTPNVGGLTAAYTSNLLAANFTSTTNSTNSISWNFGDGTTSTLANPSHNYAAEGTYNVTVTASNPCGTVTENLTVVITLLPAVGINSDITSGCAGMVVNYQDNSSSNATSWNWSFPGGTPSTSTMQNPTVTYATPGDYDVTLTVGNTAGSDTQTWTNYVDVMSAPTASYDFNVNGNVLNMVNMTSGSSAQWTIDGVTNSSLQSWSLVLAENGTYNVTLEVENPCGTDVTTFAVVIDAYPTSSINAISNMPECVPRTVTFGSSSSQTTAYQWQFPGGTPASSTDPNPVITYNTAGSYDVSLVASNQYGSDMSMMSDAVVAIDVPTVNFSSMANGASINFENTSTDGSTYSWEFGDGSTSTLESPSHMYAVAGNYEVTFVATNACGSSSLTRVVEVDFSVPSISATFSANVGCAPFSVDITDASSNNPISWMWEFPGGNPATSTDQNPTVVYDTPGIYSINAVVANADGSSTLNFADAITVGDVPIAEFSLEILSQETISLTNATLGATSYSWEFGDGNTSNENNPSHTYTESGTYDIVLTATNDCGSFQVTKTVTIEIEPSSVYDNNAFGQWAISPNPSSGEVNVLFDTSLAEMVEYKVLDLIGRRVIGGEIEAGTKRKDLVISESGVYLLILSRGNDIDVKKLTIIE